MAHTDIIKDSDKCFEIDPITRVIRNASPTKTTIIQFDHNSERFTFMFPRFIEGHDMMECTKAEVHYLNIASSGGEQSAGVYAMTDMAISAEDDSMVTCSWLISQNATKHVGSLNFLIRFSCVAEDGTIEYVWNTEIFKGIMVSTGMFNSGVIVEQYADVLEQWKQELLNAGTITTERIADGAVTKEKVDFIVNKVGKNMLNPEEMLFDKTFDTNGNIVDTTNYSITGFIPVLPGKEVAYYRSVSGVMTESKMRWLYAYDSSKVFVEKISMSGIYTVPENVAYIRAAISVTSANISSMKPMICYKANSSEYEEYVETEVLDVNTEADKIVGFNDAMRGYDETKFNCSVVPSECDAYNTTTEYVAEPDYHSLDNTYSLYDALVAQHPDYVTKTQLGTVTHNGVDMPLFRYDFKPPKITSNGMTDVFKVLMTNCIHGNETIIIPIVYRLMKDICENWRTSELLRKLRFNCHFTVVPIVNPYGYLHRQRVNENGIDLCRNFEVDFTSDLDGADTYPHGTTANSEQSTQIMTALAKSERFDFLFDMHGYGNYANNNEKAGYVVPCLKRRADVAFARCLSLWANSKILKDNENITTINGSHFHAPENEKHNGYMSGVFKNGMTFELMSGWNDATLGTDETAQKLNVEILGGAALMVLSGYDATHLRM